MYKKIQRADGSVVILVPRNESRSVTWEVMFKVGSRQEPKAINGASHFIEHLMFKGTKKRPTTKVLSQELDAVGAEYNAYTSKDRTAYYIMTASDHTQLGIDMLSDMLRNSKFEKEEMDRERGVIIEELNQYRDNPVMRIDEVFESSIFRGSSLGWEIGGPREIIRSVPHKDLLAFRDKLYYNSNAVIGLSGNFNETQALKLINRYFPVRDKMKKAVIRPFHFSQKTPRVIAEYKKTEQVQLMLGFPGYRYRHKNAHALTLLSVIMGGTMSSRLFIEIRERKGIAYDVRSTYEMYEDVGYFAVRAGLDKNRIYEALEAIKFELVRVAKKGVSHAELKRAKDNVRGKLLLKFERPNAYLSFLMNQELMSNRIESLEEKLAEIKKVTRDDVNRVARNVIRWKLANLALIGPYKSSRKFLQILKEPIRI